MNTKFLYSVALALSLALSFCLTPQYADAAIGKGKVIPKNEENQKGGTPSENSGEITKAAYNPQALEGDLILPMPNGLQMVLRAVAVPSSKKIKFLSDYSFKVGIEGANEERGFYEKQMDSYVSAPFRQKDLPSVWKQILEKAGIVANEGEDIYSYYFIGKYEVTNAQWDAVMGTQSGRPELPKADISWYDVQEFLRKYNIWLLSEHAQKGKTILPQIEDVPTYFRLPNEEEWEFAARGGDRPPEELKENFFKDAGKSVRDYAIFGSNYTAPWPIGKRTGNRLGIYDMAGNIAEMVQGGFRFHIVASKNNTGTPIRRLHGSEGGLLCKGGSFLSSSETDVYPGKRIEKRMFEFDKATGNYIPHKERSLGFRLLLSSVNIPGQIREEMLVKEEKKGTPINSDESIPEKNTTVEINMEGDLLEEFTKIINATNSPKVRSNLDQFKKRLSDEKNILEQEKEFRLIENLRSVAYHVDSIANLGFRVFEHQNRLDLIKNYTEMAKKDKKNFNSIKKEIEEKKQMLLQSMQEQYINLEASTKFYKSNLEELINNSEEVTDAAFFRLDNEYRGSSYFYTSFRKKLNIVKEHIEILRKQGSAYLTTKLIYKRILTDKQFTVVQQEAKKKKK